MMRLILPGLIVSLALVAPLSPSRAFEVAVGECRQILSGGARVGIHYASGLKAEVDPVDLNNIVTQVDVFPDGRRSLHKWIGGILPLEQPAGHYVYGDEDAKRFRPETGETRQFSFTFNNSIRGIATAGTMEVAVKGADKVALGECQATVIGVEIAVRWANTSRPARIRRLFVKEFRFFVASTVETVKDGKPEMVEFRATRLELIR